MTRQTIPTAVADLVLERDGGRCVRCGRHVADGERGRDWSVHHRRLKGLGGDKRANANLAGNLILLCGSAVSGCHGYVHLDNRKDAEAHGWIVSRHTDTPADVALLWADHGGERRWVHIDDAGTRQTIGFQEGP